MKSLPPSPWKQARASSSPEGVKTNVVLSARNLPGVKTTPANILSVYDLLNAKTWSWIRQHWL